MSAAKTRTLSFGSRRPIKSSRWAEPSVFFWSRIVRPSTFRLATCSGAESLRLKSGFERAGDVPARD